MDEVALQAELLKQFQATQPQPPQPPAGVNPADPTGSGGGVIGTGQAPIPGEQGFTGVPQASGQANTQQTETDGEQQPPMGGIQ